MYLGDKNHIICQRQNLSILPMGDCQNLRASGLYLYDVAHGLLSNGIIAAQGDDWLTVMNQGNGAVL